MGVVPLHYLTKAEIYNREQMRLIASQSQHASTYEHALFTSGTQHFLVITVDGKNFVKLTVYPVPESAIIKFTIEGECIAPAVLTALSQLSARLNVIHSSGFNFVQQRFVFEMYIAKTVAFEKFKELQQEMSHLTAIDRVSIEEIVAGDLL